MKLYPITFHPIVKKMIWGQESWDISCRPDEMSIIKNGEYAGMPFADYLAMDCERANHFTRFPLLVKIIEARDTLSVQVHPDDVYARAQGEDSGKSEMWYIIQPPVDGELIIGLRDGVTREKLHRAHETGRVEECLNRLRVKAGDMVNIPAGLIHALTPGTILAEIQQNSNTTYRLYDYNRAGADGNPRELHIEHALNVTDFSGKLPKEVTDAVRGQHFTVEKWEVPQGKARTCSTAPRAFSILVCVSGAVRIVCEGGETLLAERQSAFLSAGLGEYTLTSEGGREGLNSAAALHCTVPAHDAGARP